MRRPKASVRHVPAPVFDGLGLGDIGRRILVVSVSDSEYYGILEAIKHDPGYEDATYILLQGHSTWIPTFRIKEVYIEN